MRQIAVPDIVMPIILITGTRFFDIFVSVKVVKNVII